MNLRVVESEGCRYDVVETKVVESKLNSCFTAGEVAPLFWEADRAAEGREEGQNRRKEDTPEEEKGKNRRKVVRLLGVVT